MVVVFNFELLGTKIVLHQYSSNQHWIVIYANPWMKTENLDNKL